MPHEDRPRPQHYNANESVRGLGLMLRASVRIVRGRPVGRLEQKLDQLALEAIEREAAAKKQ